MVPKRKPNNGKRKGSGMERRGGRRRKLNFQDYLEMDMKKNCSNAEDDGANQKRIAKSLGLKRGKLDDAGDGLTDLLGDINASDDEANGAPELHSPGASSSTSESEVDSEEEQVDEEEDSFDENEAHRGETTAEPSVSKYVPPHQREKPATEEDIQLKRRIKGLLNRVSEDNIESITSDINGMFQLYPRKSITDVITNHVLESCSTGPRGNEQYAAVFGGCIAGISCLVGMDFGANFMAGLASTFERQYEKDDGLGVRNLTLLISSLYNLKLISSDLVFSLLQHLCKRFKEIDVATILHLMQACGMSLRNQDPASMKSFILSVHERTAELKRGLNNNGNEGMSKRVEFMLETICEIKNNKRKENEPARHTRMKKWLQKLNVENVQLCSVTWMKLVDPSKKGQWWLSSMTETAQQDVPKVVALIDSGAAEAEKMLKLASSQRMNTDARRAIFSIIMSSENYVDAFQKLLRLSLKGKQDREIPRVIVQCCLQEKVFNKYYALLASKLCHHDKNHKYTLQYCFWDHFKELRSMDVRRLVNLAKLLAFLVGSSALPLSTLKAVEFADPRTMTPNTILHFRLFFEALLTENDEKFIVSAFSRVASFPELSLLKTGLALFLRQHVYKESVGDETETGAGSLLQHRCLIAKKALLSSSRLPV